MNHLNRPRPIRGIYEDPFWEGANAGELRLQKCQSCGHVWYPPGPVCPHCLSEKWAFAPMSGRGRLLAWTVFHRSYFESIPVPYLVASIELEEGPLMIGNVLGLDPGDARLGLALRVAFQAAGDAANPWQIVQWQVAAHDEGSA